MVLKLNSSRVLIVSKVSASVLSFGLIALLANFLPSSDLGTVFKCLFISQSLLFLTDQGLTPTLVQEQSFGTNLAHDVARINYCLRLRMQRFLIPIPALVILLLLITDASYLAIFAICLSHLSTSVYSTINAGLLGANLRYVETISEPSSRFFAFVFGTVTILAFDQFRNAQSIIFIYAAADLLMLSVVFILYFQIYSKIDVPKNFKLNIPIRYRLQSTVTVGTQNTVGMGESWSLSVLSSASDFAFYGLIMRVIDISGLIASHAGYSHLPQLISTVQDSQPQVLLARLRKIAILSLIPSCILFGVTVTARLELITFKEYDVRGLWLSVLVLVFSIPAVVISKYLAHMILSINPKALMSVSFFTGIYVTTGVSITYPIFGLNGTLVVIASANFFRATWLYLAAQQAVKSKFTTKNL